MKLLALVVACFIFEGCNGYRFRYRSEGTSGQNDAQGSDGGTNDPDESTIKSGEADETVPLKDELYAFLRELSLRDDEQSGTSNGGLSGSQDVDPDMFRSTGTGEQYGSDNEGTSESQDFRPVAFRSIGSDEQYNGGISENREVSFRSHESGSDDDLNDLTDEHPDENDDEDTCSVLELIKLLPSLRSFPSGEVKEMTGFDPAVFDQMLEDFFNKMSAGSNATDESMERIALVILGQRYKCAATQFNQVMIHILSNTIEKFMTNYGRKMMERIKMALRMMGKGPGKGGHVSSEITAGIMDMVNITIRNDIILYDEIQEFYDVGCFLEMIWKYLENKIENGEATLEDFKAEFKKEAEKSGIFKCTEPSSLMQSYKEWYQESKKPSEENDILDDLKEAFEMILPEGKGARKGAKLIARKLAKIIHEFIVKISMTMKPVVKAKSEVELNAYLEARLSGQQLAIAKELVRKLGLFTGTNPTSKRYHDKSPENGLPPDGPEGEGGTMLLREEGTNPTSKRYHDKSPENGLPPDGPEGEGGTMLLREEGSSDAFQRRDYARHYDRSPVKNHHRNRMLTGYADELERLILREEGSADEQLRDYGRRYQDQLPDSSSENTLAMMLREEGSADAFHKREDIFEAIRRDYNSEVLSDEDNSNVPADNS